MQQSAWSSTNEACVAKVALPTAGTPGSRWSWRGLVRDPVAPDLAPEPDVVRTLPSRPEPGEPSAFSFAFGCCTTRTLGPAFRSLLEPKLQFFALIGDMGYPDRPGNWVTVSQDYAGYVGHFAGMLANDLFRPITASMPVFFVQDDHDYGYDDCDRTSVQPWAAQAFADLMPGGAYPARNYRSWSVGEVDFFLTDNRRWKDPDLGPFQNDAFMSVLGSRQRTWLLQGLAASTARLKCVFIPMTMAWYWSRAETQEVLRFIADHVSGTVIFLSGDKHAGAYARYTPQVWEFMAAPMCNPDKHKTPARTPAVFWTENGTGTALYNAYGAVDVDTLSTRTCTLRLMREDGVEMHREVVPLGT